MFRETISNVLLEQVPRATQASPGVLFIITLCTLWAFWRIWTFTIVPILRPDEPKDIPYWVPFLGHAVAFFKNSNQVFAYGRDYLHNTYEPFALTVAGERIYIVTLPEDVAAVYRNNTSLEFDTHVQDLFKSFDGSLTGLAKLQTPYREFKTEGADTSTEQLPSSSLDYSVGLHIRHSYKQQLQPGEKLDTLEIKILESFEKSICNLSSQGKKRLSIREWVRSSLLDAGTAALYGEQLMQIEPNFLSYFGAFDYNSWMLLYHYPKFFSDPVQVPKRKVLDAFASFFELPMEKRPGVAHFLRTIEVEQRKLDLANRDIASSAFIFYWAINSNPWKLCFWVLSYILFDPSLHSAIKSETKPAIRAATADIDMQYLIDHCPHLEAVFNEALRLTAASTSIRNVVYPTAINGKSFRAGSKVLLPYRPMHFNAKVFGPRPDLFKPQRFLDNPNLGRSPSFRPWGGGSTFCPGRFLARRMICALIALTLHRFDVEQVKGQAFPKRDEITPNLGIMESMRGDELFVMVRPLSLNEGEAMNSR